MIPTGIIGYRLYLMIPMSKFIPNDPYVKYLYLMIPIKIFLPNDSYVKNFPKKFFTQKIQKTNFFSSFFLKIFFFFFKIFFSIYVLLTIPIYIVP